MPDRPIPSLALRPAAARPRVRFVGDAVAVVAGESEKAVDQGAAAHQGEVSGARAGARLPRGQGWQRPRASGGQLACALPGWGGQPAQPVRERHLRRRGRGRGASGLRRGRRPRLPHQGLPAGHDGDLPHLYRDRPLRPAAHRLLHADRVPCAPHHRQRAGHPEKQDPRRQRAHRARLRRQADGRWPRSIPRS